MATKQLALAALLLGIASPGQAFDTRDEPTTVMFYYAIPLDAKAKKESSPWFGMQINSKRDYQVQSMDFDSRRFNFAEEGGSAAASLLVIGGIAIGAAALVSTRGKSSQQQVQQEQAAAKPPVPCPTDCDKK